MFIPSPEWFAQALRWLRRAYRACRKQATHDHTAINSGWYTKPYVESNEAHFYTVVACAPSEHLRRPDVPDATRVRDFLTEHVPLPFPAQPFQSYPNVVMFEEMTSDGDRPYAARVLNTGLVELFVRVPHETYAQGDMIIDLLDVFRPATWLLSAVRTGGYQRLFELRTRMRRLDWYIALTPSISTDRGSRKRNDLVFPGRRPQMRSTQGATPNRPLAPEALRNLRQTAEPETVLRAAITALVRESGWSGDDVAAAVTDTVEAVLANEHR